jgi:DNA-binding transcriptional LysR family regulator
MPVVRQALQALQTSMETLAAVHSGARGILRVGAIPAAIMSAPGAALLALGELNPGLEIQVVEGIPAGLLAGRESVSLDEVARYPWVRAPLGVNVREVFDRLFAGRPEPPAVHAVSTSSPSLIMALLADNRTITLGPATTANWYLQRGLASRLRVEMNLPLEDLGVVYPLDATGRPGMAELLNLLRARSQLRAQQRSVR